MWPNLTNLLLDSVSDYLGIALAHHEAGSDARAAGLILQAALRETGSANADELAAGQKANVTLAAADRMYPAKVASLSPVAVQAVSLTGSTGSATVETLLDFSGEIPPLRPGSSATVKIFTDHRENAVVVPYEAVCSAVSRNTCSPSETAAPCSTPSRPAICSKN